MLTRTHTVTALFVVVTLTGCLSESDWDEHNPNVTPDSCTVEQETRCGSGGTLLTCTEGRWASESCDDLCQAAGKTYQRCDYNSSGTLACICASADPCAGVTCSGHGVCKAGTCGCATGYAGASCDSCASGYTGYPDCKKAGPCDCSSSSQTLCAGTTSIKICDGCHLTQYTCTSVCSPKKSSGCANDLSQKKDVCWCDATKQIILFNAINKCASKTPTLKLFDMTDQTASSSYTLAYNVQRQIALGCKAGHKICWGAWAGDTYWGCGDGCKQTCSTCCTICGSQLEVGFSLTCG